jgi:hypothetical protein
MGFVRTLNRDDVIWVTNAKVEDVALEIVHEGKDCDTKVRQTGARHLELHHVLGRSTVRGGPIVVRHFTDDWYAKKNLAAS